MVSSIEYIFVPELICVHIDEVDVEMKTFYNVNSVLFSLRGVKKLGGGGVVLLSNDKY